MWQCKGLTHTHTNLTVNRFTASAAQPEIKGEQIAVRCGIEGIWDSRNSDDCRRFETLPQRSRHCILNLSLWICSLSSDWIYWRNSFWGVWGNSRVLLWYIWRDDQDRIWNVHISRRGFLHVVSCQCKSFTFLQFFRTEKVYHILQCENHNNNVNYLGAIRKAESQVLRQIRVCIL